MTSDADIAGRRSPWRDVTLVGAGVLLAVMAAFIWWTWSGRAGDNSAEESPGSTANQPSSAPTGEVILSQDLLATAHLEIVPVRTAPLVDRLQVTGTVQANQEQMQQVTPLISGRVERIEVQLGSHAREGAPLLTLSSQQIAELQGNLRAAEARLAEATATLNRTQQLVELGAGAGKDLVAAQAEQRTAEAQVEQVRGSLQALGAAPGASPNNAAATSTVVIRAPMSGTVIDRTVNAGTWIEAGKPVLTLANLSTVWVIVNVPEARLGVVRSGSPATISAAVLDAPRMGRVSYIDPQIDQQTRTARVRVEVPNPNERLKLGMFVTVLLQGQTAAGATELTIPDAAVQQIGDRTVVFLATNQPARFQVRDVDLGDAVDGQRVVRAGLGPGDRVVTVGAFVLKSQLLKGQFGEDEELGSQKGG